MEITEIPPDLFSAAFRQERIRIIGERNVTDIAEIHERLLLAKEADLEEGTRRLHIVSRALRGESHEPVPPRTLRRWISAYRAGEAQYGNGYTGLLPKPNHGNLMSKLSEKARSLMGEHIAKDYESPKQKTMFAVSANLPLAALKQTA